MSDPTHCHENHHLLEATVRFDGGNLDCGSGLLLQIRRRIDPLERGQLLEILSNEPSVVEDLPAWCRMTGNDLVSTWHDRQTGSWSFLVSKNRFDPARAKASTPQETRDSPSEPEPPPTIGPAQSRKQARAVIKFQSSLHFRSWASGAGRAGVALARAP